MGRTSDRWREIAIAVQATPAEIEEQEGVLENVEILPGQWLASYRAEVVRFLNDVIVDGRDYIDRDAQLKIFWNFRVLSEEDLNYDRYRQKT